MNKCFITKLPSSVDNDNLPVLGQLRINWLKQSDLADNEARAIGLSTNDSITIKVSGAHLTDNTLSSNLGNSKTITKDNGLVWLYVSNDADAVLTIDNKYSLTNINFVRPGKEGLKRSVKFDIDDIRYCTALTSINLANTQVSGKIDSLANLTKLTGLHLANTNVSGDISALSNLTALAYLDLNNIQVSGDISAVSKLTALTDYLGLNNTQVSGDINAVSQLTALTRLNLANTQVSGDINAVSQLTALTRLDLANTQVSGDISALSNLTALSSLVLANTQVSGKIDSLANLTKLTNGSFNGLSLTGDMSKIPARVYYISLSNRKVNTNFTWTANGRQNVKLLAMEGSIPFDTASMDNMLIDQATCTFEPNTSMPRYNVIGVSGTRTSASDAAVTTLQSKGVTITGVTKAS